MTPREFHIAINLRGDDGSTVFRTVTLREDFDHWLTMSFGDTSATVEVKDRQVVTLEIPIEGASNLGVGSPAKGIDRRVRHSRGRRRTDDDNDGLVQ